MKVLYYIFTIILLETEALPKAKTSISQNDQHLERNKRSPDSFGLQRTVNYQVDSPGGQFHFENRDSNGYVFGCYGMKENVRNTYYISDENGYRVLTKLKASVSSKADFFPAECFPDQVENFAEFRRPQISKHERPENLVSSGNHFQNAESNLLQLDGDLLQNSVLIQQPTALKTKMMMKKGSNGHGDVPVMVVLVPFCPNQHKTQFPPLAGVIPAKSTAFRLASTGKDTAKK